MSYIQQIQFVYKNLLKQWCKEHNLSLEKCIKQAIYSNDKKIRTIVLFTKILLERK